MKNDVHYNVFFLTFERDFRMFHVRFTISIFIEKLHDNTNQTKFFDEESGCPVCHGVSTKEFSAESFQVQR